MTLQYTKLFQTITASTIWCEDSDTRIVWVTLLAMADRNGKVYGSVPGLANIARVPIEKCRAALEKFQQPDPDSTTPDEEGRRIKLIPGGWLLITHGKYRDLRDDDERRAYKRNWIAQKRTVARASRTVEDALDNVKRIQVNGNHVDKVVDK